MIEIVGQIYQQYIKLYQATGGLISLEKSIFYFWIWTVVKGKMVSINITETYKQIPLKQLMISEGSQTLGMKLDPSLNFYNATKFIINKIVQFQTKMHGTPSSETDVTVTAWDLTAVIADTVIVFVLTGIGVSDLEF